MLGPSFTDLLASSALDALAVLLPVTCAGCGAPDRALCGECRRALEGPPDGRLVRRGVGEGRHHVDVVAALPYDGTVRRCILSFKAEGRTDVARALAGPLARAIADVLERYASEMPAAGDILVCPVPQGRSSEHARGYDPVRVLARRALDMPVERMLRRAPNGPSQKLLGAEERHSTVAHTFSARRPLGGRLVLLVDDVVTSGASLAEAARAVRAAGGVVVGAATLAATPLRNATLDERP